MSRIATYPALAALWFGTALQAAGPVLPDDLAMLTTCEARYSALVRNTWLVQDSADGATLRRDLFAAMADALLETQPEAAALERGLLSLRISERQDMSRLLDTIHFGTDARRGRIALGMMGQRLAACDRLLLDRTTLSG